MSRRRQSKPAWAELASELDPEDGSDPKEFHRHPWHAPKAAGRKALQLCGQVKDALVSALPACADGILQSLEVVSVEPAPHSGRLRVVLRSGEGGPSVERVSAQLLRAAGVLRAEVAAAVCRRHAPELVFEVIG